MTSDFIELDQTLHGYENGHRLLASSLRLDPRDERALLTMSDLSGPSASENFLEYLTGYMLPSGSHYAVAKTWYANEMERPGCVWTHTFLISTPGIDKLYSLKSILGKFFRPRLRSGYRYTDKLQVQASEYQHSDYGIVEVQDEQPVLCAIEALYSSDEDPVSVVAGSGTEFEDLALRLWSQVWPSLRREFSFCTGSLAKRVLLGKPLALQFGPERAMKEIRTRSLGECDRASWVDAIVSDLEGETPLRTFLSKNGSGLSRRSSVSRLTRVYVLLQKREVSRAMRVVANDYGTEEVEALREVILDQAREVLAPIALLKELIASDAIRVFRPTPESLGVVVELAVHQDKSGTLEAISKSLPSFGSQNRKVVMSALADKLDTNSIVGIAESHSELFAALIEERGDLGFLPQLWSSNLSLLDKIDLFDSLRSRSDVDKGLLFEAILKSQDVDLCSELIAHFSESDLPMVLDWLEQSDWSMALRPQWLLFLRRFQAQVFTWANNRSASKQLILILANVFDLPSSSSLRLSEETILALASEGRSLIAERHEVAAFIYLTTTAVRNPRGASFCFSAFAVLHQAIAESRLSNRAWQLLEPNLKSLPDEEWNVCEKLRRSVLFYSHKHGWPTQELWRIVAQNSNLFHDFLRTARAYDEGRVFFAKVRDAGVKGECELTKQQFKEIKKLLR
jgi:hypothetical protein